MINTELNIKNLLNKISSRENLTYDEATVIFTNIVERRIHDYGQPEL